MVQLPVAELRMSACFPRRGVPPERRRSRADGIMIMICYAHAHLCGAQGGEEGEVCFRLMSLTPQHSHQACSEVNRSLAPHSLSAVCSVFRALSDSRGRCSCIRAEDHLNIWTRLVCMYSRTGLQSVRENVANEMIRLHKNKYKVHHYNVESTQALRLFY